MWSVNKCRCRPSKLKVCKCSRTSFNKTDATNRSKRQSTGELICPTGKNFVARENLSTPSRKNIPLRVCPKSNLQFPLSRSHKRGASRSSRTLGAGCDGRTSPSAMIARTNGVCADGEVVWSRRSDAVAKFVKTLPASHGRRWQPSYGHRGEHEGNR